MNDIKDMVGKNKNTQEHKVARFLRCEYKNLIYVTECGFEFPIPTSDLGNSSVSHTEKALLLMRYIRKEIARLENQRVVRFLRYANGNLIYSTQEGFEFPVPMSDFDDSRIFHIENEELFEKYIEAQLKEINK